MYLKRGRNYSYEIEDLKFKIQAEFWACFPNHIPDLRTPVSLRTLANTFQMHAIFSSLGYQGQLTERVQMLYVNIYILRKSFCSRSSNATVSCKSRQEIYLRMITEGSQPAGALGTFSGIGASSATTVEALLTFGAFLLTVGAASSSSLASGAFSWLPVETLMTTGDASSSLASSESGAFALPALDTFVAAGVSSFLSATSLSAAFALLALEVFFVTAGVSSSASTTLASAALGAYLVVVTAASASLEALVSETLALLALEAFLATGAVSAAAASGGGEEEEEEEAVGEGVEEVAAVLK